MGDIRRDGIFTENSHHILRDPLSASSNVRFGCPDEAHIPTAFCADRMRLTQITVSRRQCVQTDGWMFILAARLVLDALKRRDRLFSFNARTLCQHQCLAIFCRITRLARLNPFVSPSIRGIRLLHQTFPNNIPSAADKASNFVCGSKTMNAGYMTLPFLITLLSSCLNNSGWCYRYWLDQKAVSK